MRLRARIVIALLLAATASAMVGCGSADDEKTAATTAPTSPAAKTPEAASTSAALLQRLPGLTGLPDRLLSTAVMVSGRSP